MYKILNKEDILRIPPDLLDDNFEKTVEELTHSNFEGKVDNENNLIVVATNIEPIGDGRIVHGDGGVYQHVKYNALVFKPEMHEVIEGTVCEVLKFGVFVRFGPLDGLLHISQVMDDHIDVDTGNDRLVGKETKRELKIGDKVRARIVAISINERNPRESKIGLTMRQPGLGKLEWIIEDRMKPDERAAKETKKKKRSKSKRGKKKKK
ncbi:MAG: DNA-directed RNA polymerase [Thermoplasmata archaeon]|nr:MAG: DNA-directed RNA polymerase [Thermoplasmata archaeon]